MKDTRRAPQTRVLLHWVYSLWVGEELTIERPLPTIGRNGCRCSPTWGYIQKEPREHQQPMRKTDRMSPCLDMQSLCFYSESVPTPRTNNSCA